MSINNIGLFGKFNDHSVADAVIQVKKFLESNNLSVYLGHTTSSQIEGMRLEDQEKLPNELLDLSIVVGGDGTMLSVARELSKFGVPAVGINIGRLGFLTDIPMSNFEIALGSILEGNFHVEHRTLLQCKVIREGKKLLSSIALNEIVLSKGNIGRLIEFSIHVNDQYVTKPRGDGLIISTPTGSTAYALSAGGPIIYPDLPVICLSPICPHTLSNRPILLSETDQIHISNIEPNEFPPNLALDGVMLMELDGSEIINISRAKQKLQLVKSDRFNYFETLYNKLGWHG
ncbi:MAG: NAD(+)/NADH kinase [Gammaproteobacteria bacterium]|nr:NAD(+)/NADH kinase [Gammaproteobacteria bacterium]MCY4219135.1 NAD(+)/NADH kinase [Gammaproteobacteria bacterium]MCY4275028.1 NAD(+)/NADH kinase [Gammaproteobacteria bacterium]